MRLKEEEEEEESEPRPRPRRKRRRLPKHPVQQRQQLRVALGLLAHQVELVLGVEGSRVEPDLALSQGVGGERDGRGSGGGWRRSDGRLVGGASEGQGKRGREEVPVARAHQVCP